MMWLIRAGEGGWAIDAFREKGFVGIGFIDKEKVPDGISRDALVDRFRKLAPTSKEGTVKHAASQVRRFVFEVKVGDPVLTYDPERREYLVGEIISDYEWQKDDKHPHIRRVKWTKHASRDALRVDTRNSLGTTLTILSARRRRDGRRARACRAARSQARGHAEGCAA